MGTKSMGEDMVTNSPIVAMINGYRSIKEGYSRENYEEQLMGVFNPYLAAYSRRINIKNYDKEDLMQMGYMYLFIVLNKIDLENIKNFTDNRVIGYVVKSIRNCYFMEVRKFGKSNLEVSIDTNDEINELIIYNLRDTFCIEDYIIGKQLSQKLIDGINALEEKEKNIIISFYVYEKKLKQYATENNYGYNACKKRKKKALENIATYIGRE